MTFQSCRAHCVLFGCAQPTHLNIVACGGTPPPQCQLTLTMSRLAQVPSHTPLLVDMFLDMISHNTQGHSIPPGLNFKDKSGHFLFHDKVAPYLQGFTTRVCANVLTPHGGGAGSNNATESQNKIAHKQMPVRKAPVTHADTHAHGLHCRHRIQ